MIKAFHTCKKLIGSIVCAAGIGIFLSFVLPPWLLVIVLSLAVIFLGVAGFMC